MNCLRRKVSRQSPDNPTAALNPVVSKQEISSKQVQGPQISDKQITAGLVSAGLGWRSTADRFLKPAKSWVPRSRFKPLSDLRHAFELLEAVTNDYRIIETPGSGLVVEVHVGLLAGRASGQSKARCISLTLAQALQIRLGASR